MIKNRSNIVYSTRLDLEWKKLGNYEAADEIPKVARARKVLDFVWLMLDLLLVFLYSLPMILFAAYRMVVPPDKKDISGELALVTGGGNGLGRAMVLELVSCGARVAIGDVDLAAAKQTAQDACALARCNDAARAYELDVSSTKSIAQVKKQIMNDFDKPVSILINNAALLPVVSSLSGTDEEVSRIMNVNCLGNIWMYRAFLPSMIERDHGHIVTISSVAGLEPIGYMTLYTCSKFGVRGFARALAQELRTQGRAVRVSVAMPYFVATRKGLVDIVKARIPPMDVNKTAARIIDGMRRNYGEFTVPGYFYYLLTLASTFPERIHDLFREIFWVKIDAD